jgi:FkbH-like protein
LWHHAKQEIAPVAVPWAGDQVARVLAALRGLSRKALVLDLDNTLWGGVIGDDGLDGIVLGQGSATGEAFVALQRYLKRLASRGVLLAVSSKNDRATAQAVFREHPEMVLRLGDIAVFEANWEDKPSALRRIAAELNLGLDALAFLDDNPAERALARRTLPEVAVPEPPDAPELFAQTLSDAGLFEPVAVTADDLCRGAHYAANVRRAEAQESATDLESFIRDLDMTLTVGAFKPADLARITQLVNKTNQFNLTTRRYTEPEIRALAAEPDTLALAARLSDRFGDNGLIAVVIARRAQDGDLDIETWLMSCRVIGRRVEHALLAALMERARLAGYRRLIGHYFATSRNGLVKDLYPTLGFRPLPGLRADPGRTHWALDLDGPPPPVRHLTLIQAR